MASIHLIQSIEATTQEDGSLRQQRPALWLEWFGDWVPAGDDAAEVYFYFMSEAASDRTAVIEFLLPVPADVDTDNPDAVEDFIRQNAANLTGPVVRANTVGKKLIADEAARIPQPKYWEYNDCRPDGVDAALPATHWLWSVGNIWHARQGETLESWFDQDLLDALGHEHTDWLIRPIHAVPKSGTLTYSTKDGDEVHVDLDAPDDGIEAA